MRSIQLQSTLFSLHFELNHIKQLQTAKLSRLFSGQESARLGTLQRKKLHFSLRGRTAMIDSTPIVLGLNSPAKSVDLSTFLQTSAILLILYWISNFIVPDIISKYFQFGKDDENEEQRDEDNA